jgi:murein DD-endopeptidase MepM/ murein hydrolase activator NlpD
MIFHWPIGLDDERTQFNQLPGAWISATMYGERYSATGAWAVHTGLDLNLNQPHWDSDAHSPVYAAGDGQIVFVGDLPVWGMVIVIEHDDREGGVLFTRYAHVEQVMIRNMSAILRGEPIARVGNADGRFAYHLHFDIARCNLRMHPGDWPGDDLARVQRDYLDPIKFMRAQNALESDGQVLPSNMRRRVTAVPSLRLRTQPQKYSTVIANLSTGAIVEVTGAAQGEWTPVRVQVNNLPKDGWVFTAYTEVAL